jgi:hypothetical protein
MNNTEIGIYKITNLLNNRVYIGQSEHLSIRFNQHVTLLKNGSHHNKELQKDFSGMNEKKDLEFFLDFEIIKPCLKSELNQMEQQYIDQHRNQYGEDTVYNKNY